MQANFFQTVVTNRRRSFEKRHIQTNFADMGFTKDLTTKIAIFTFFGKESGNFVIT